jgi:flagellum-specific peptidoglycan hydrolase FlgJ
LTQAEVDEINSVLSPVMAPPTPLLAPHPHLQPHTILAAQASERKWKVPTSISLAQYALESAWGDKDLGVNNFFGMKVRAGKDDPYILLPTREVIHGKSVMVQAKFRRFPSEEAAFDAHGELLGTAPVYAKARAKLPDVDAFADALTGVYATDPGYGKALKNLMLVSKLYQYNLAGRRA